MEGTQRGTPTSFRAQPGQLRLLLRDWPGPPPSCSHGWRPTKHCLDLNHLLRPRPFLSTWLGCVLCKGTRTVPGTR